VNKAESWRGCSPKRLISTEVAITTYDDEGVPSYILSNSQGRMDGRDIVGVAKIGILLDGIQIIYLLVSQIHDS